MGIKDLSAFLRGKCISCFSRVSMAVYSYKKVAIDTFIFLYTFKRMAGSPYSNPHGMDWVIMFTEFVASFRINNVHPIFIFEGSSPPEKSDERTKRIDLKEKAEIAVFDLEIDMEAYHKTGEISEKLVDLDKKLKSLSAKRLIDKQNISNTATPINIEALETKIKKMRGNIVSITKDDIDLCKELFQYLSIPYFTAPFEAETMCYDLYKKGLVDEILSDDTDILAYRALSVLTKFDQSSQSFVRVDLSIILQELEMTGDEFLDFCVMCGCDYNKNIFRIGPEGAYKLIKSYKNIEAVEASGIDTTVLKYQTTRGMFNNYIPCTVESVPYCGSPNFDQLRELFMLYNIEVDFTSLRSKFSSNIIFD
jgi:flap endonuclease-1